MISHQSFAEIQRDCHLVGGVEDDLPWVNETNCNCPGTDSPIPVAGERSPLSHVGRTPVYLPNVGVPLKPHGPHPGEQLSGYNYHFPKAGACLEGASLGDVSNGAACTWRRLPMSRMIYGNDLISNGWDRAFVPDKPDNVSHTQANIDAFARAFKALDRLISPQSCGQ
jgi:hypothetical protein